MYKVVLSLLIFGFIAVTTNAIEETNDIVSMHLGFPLYKQDRQCAMLGGYCVPKQYCISPTSTPGLCPSYQHLGVECCYETITAQAPCEQHLGECMQWCNKDLQRPATDCAPGAVCCVLV